MLRTGMHAMFTMLFTMLVCLMVRRDGVQQWTLFLGRRLVHLKLRWRRHPQTHAIVSVGTLL
jgi:hypothetical protein